MKKAKKIKKLSVTMALTAGLLLSGVASAWEPGPAPGSRPGPGPGMRHYHWHWHYCHSANNPNRYKCMMTPSGRVCGRGLL